MQKSEDVEITTRFDNVIELLRERHFQRAKELVEVISIDYPNSPRPLTMLGHIAKQTGNFNKAEAYYRRSLELDNGYHAARYHLFRFYGEMMQQTEALEYGLAFFEQAADELLNTQIFEVLNRGVQSLYSATNSALPSDQKPRKTYSIRTRSSAIRLLKYFKELSDSSRRENPVNIEQEYAAIANIFFDQNKFSAAGRFYHKLINSEEFGYQAVVRLIDCYILTNNFELAYELTEEYKLKEIDSDLWLRFMAEAALRQGHWNEALEFLQKYEFDEEFAAWAHRRIGRCFEKLGNEEKAAAYFEKAFILENASEEECYDEVQHLIECDENHYAEVGARKSLKKYPSSSGLHILLGNALSHCGRLDEGIIAYKEAIRLNKDDASAYYNIGLTMAERNELDSAEYYYKKASECSRPSIFALTNLGNLLTDRGDFDKALAVHSEALLADPKYTKAKINSLITTYLRNRPGEQDEALSTLDVILKDNRHNLDAIVQIGHFFLKIGKFNRAAEVFKHAKYLQPNEPDYWTSLAVSLYHEGRKSEARKLNLSALEKFPENVTTNYNVAVDFHYANELDEAEFFYRKSLEINPNHEDALNNLGVLLLEGGYRDQEAFKYLEEAIRVKPSHFNAISNLGFAYLRNSKFGLAQDCFLDAWDLNQVHGPILFRLALCCFWLDNESAETYALDHLENEDRPEFGNLSAIILQVLDGNHHNALKKLNRIIMKEGTNVQSLLVRAKLYKLLGDDLSAESDLQELKNLTGAFKGFMNMASLFSADNYNETKLMLKESVLNGNDYVDIQEASALRDILGEI